MLNKGFLIIISAPSGGGKTSILKAIRSRIPSLEYSVSTTTRPPRRGERDGRDYYFINRDEFMKCVKDSGFTEWAQVHGHLYGTRDDFIRDKLDSGKSVLLDLDIQGALQIREKYPDAVLIFISPPSEEVLKKRLKKRGTDSDKQINMRIMKAEDEISKSGNYDYIVVNDVLKKAVGEVERIIEKEIECRSCKKSRH